MSSRTRGRGGRGECADRRPAACGDGVAEAPVVGPEVVAPARDAVRLVDDEAVYREPAELVEEPRRAEALRREVEETQLAARPLPAATRTEWLRLPGCGRRQPERRGR